MKLLLVCILSVFTAVKAGSEWHYEGASGPDAWASMYPTCGGTSQSPINIVTGATVMASSNNHFDFIDYNKYYSNFKMTNNGHTVQVNTNTDRLRVKNGALPGDYALEQFHFHWGPDDNTGSEHEMNGHEYPLEIHLVHHNIKFPDVSTALSEDGGVAVLGIFAKITTGNDANPAFDRLIQYFKNVPYSGDSTTMGSFNVYDLLPHSHSFYRYKGSLTTPACTEGIIWSVFDESIKVTSEQLKEFRHLHAATQANPDEEIIENHRPVQPLNGRTVYKYS